MTLQDVMGTLRQQHEVFTLSGAYIDGARFVARLLDTLGTVQITVAETPLTLSEAAVETGYSSDHLGSSGWDGFPTPAVENFIGKSVDSVFPKIASVSTHTIGMRLRRSQKPCLQSSC
jgi:hypothetical protein